MIKVSVIVPIYNVEDYLKECLDSILNQTLSEIEVICVNDGSTDNSLQILEEYRQRDERIVIIDKENGGYGMAMNIGMQKATGEFIGIVEPDDFIKADMYEHLYKTATKHLLDFVKADFYRFKKDAGTGELLLDYNKLDSTGRFYNRVICPSETPEVIKLIMNTWSGIYRREFIEKNAIRHNETPGAAYQDNGFFWQTFMYAQRAMFLNRPYYMNRRDNPNSSVHNKDKVYSMNREYDYIRGVFMRSENHKLWDVFKSYYNYKRYHNYMFTLNRIGSEYKKEYVLEIAKELKTAYEAGEFEDKLFSWKGRKEFKLLIKRPEAFYVYMTGDKSEKGHGFYRCLGKLVRSVRG